MIVGHSLGGYLAQIVGCINNIQTYTFNAPGARTYLPANLEYLKEEKGKKIQNYVADDGFNFIPRGTHIGERKKIDGYTHSMEQVYDTIKTRKAVPIKL